MKVWIPAHPVADLCSEIFASIAEFERSLITERVKSGQAAAKRRGVGLVARASISTPRGLQSFADKESRMRTSQRLRA